MLNAFVFKAQGCEATGKGMAPASELSFFTPTAPAPELQFLKVWLRLHVTLAIKSESFVSLICLIPEVNLPLTGAQPGFCLA